MIPPAHEKFFDLLIRYKNWIDKHPNKDIPFYEESLKHAEKMIADTNHDSWYSALIMATYDYSIYDKRA